MKKLFKFIKIIIVIVLLLVATMLALTKFYEKQIVNKAVDLINKNISVPVSVNNISLNIFRSFPNITLKLDNIKIESPKTLNTNSFQHINSYQLLDLKNVYLSFNLRALLDNTFELSEIVFSDGTIQVLVDKRGYNNYDLLTQKKSTSESDKLNVLLKKVQFSNINLVIENAYKKSFVSLNSNKLLAKGAFYKEKYTLNTEGSIQISKYVNGEITFVPKQKTSLAFNLGINNDTVNIKNGTFVTKGISFETTGVITTGSKPYIDIAIIGRNISLSSLLELLPKNTIPKNNFKTVGYLGINTKVKGYLTEKISPKVKANFKIHDGEIMYSKSEFSVNNIFLSGQYSSYSKPTLNISEFAFITDSSKFNGKLMLDSFQNPVVSLQSTFAININDITELVSLKNVSTLNGKVNGELKAKGKLPKEITINSISNILQESQVSCSNINIGLNDSPLKITSFYGNLLFSTNRLSFKNLKGKFIDVETTGSGSIDNFAGVFSESYHPVTINANASFDRVNYQNFKFLFANESESTKKTSYIINANLNVKEFLYDKLKTSNLSTNFKYKNKTVEFSNLKFSAFGGSANSYVELKPKGNATVLYTKAETKDLDISRVFDVFNNFDQQFITHKNIKGRVSSSFDGEIFIINNKAELNTLDLLGHLTIVNGELINFEPIQKLSSFSSISELSHLKFDTLQNDLLISNGKINIPSMDISNNAMNLNIFGEQEFNGDFEYHIKILLSELLGNKNKKIRQQQSEFGTIQDDGLGKTTLYLVATGKQGETKVKFDKKELGKHLKSEMKEEKKELKKILNKEFGWFKKDSTLNQNEKPKQKHFEIEWDEE